MSEKSYVSMEQKVCPVCGKQHTFDCGILLDRRLKDSMERYTTTGYGMCEEHDKLWKDGFVALIVSDPDKSNPEEGLSGLYRTGEIIHMKIEPFKEMFGIDTVRPLVAIDIPMAEQLKQMMQAVQNEQ